MKQAFNDEKLAADRGVPASMRNVALNYRKGIADEKNISVESVLSVKQVKKYLSGAAQLGDTDAIREMIQLLINSDLERAAIYFRFYWPRHDVFSYRAIHCFLSNKNFSPSVIYHLGTLLETLKRSVVFHHYQSDFDKEQVLNLENNFNSLAINHTEFFIRLLLWETKRDQVRICKLLSEQGQASVHAFLVKNMSDSITRAAVDLGISMNIPAEVAKLIAGYEVDIRVDAQTEEEEWQEIVGFREKIDEKGLDKAKQVWCSLWGGDKKVSVPLSLRGPVVLVKEWIATSQKALLAMTGTVLFFY